MRKLHEDEEVIIYVDEDGHMHVEPRRPDPPIPGIDSGPGCNIVLLLIFVALFMGGCFIVTLFKGMPA
jgi:hypothetical protein